LNGAVLPWDRGVVVCGGGMTIAEDVESPIGLMRGVSVGYVFLRAKRSRSCAFENVERDATKVPTMHFFNSKTKINS